MVRTRKDSSKARKEETDEKESLEKSQATRARRGEAEGGGGGCGGDDVVEEEESAGKKRAKGEKNGKKRKTIDGEGEPEVEVEDDFPLEKVRPTERRCTFDPSVMLKVLSWNVNGIRALLKKNGDTFERLVKEEQPHVLFLQETKISESDIAAVDPSFDFLRDSYDVFWNCCSYKKGYSGTAVLVSKGLHAEDPVFGIPTFSENERVITVKIPSLKLACIGAYVPNSGDGLVRLPFRISTYEAKLSDYIRDLIATDERIFGVVYTGDLNVAHTPIDLHRPKGNERSAGFTQEERDAFSSLLDRDDLVDTYRYFHPNTRGAYSYWGYRFQARSKNKGWRLDYHLLSRRLMPALVDAFILSAVQGSDHCPVGCVLNTTTLETLSNE